MRRSTSATSLQVGTLHPWRVTHGRRQACLVSRSRLNPIPRKALNLRSVVGLCCRAFGISARDILTLQAGVFAVMAGMVLWINIRARLDLREVGDLLAATLFPGAPKLRRWDLHCIQGIPRN